MEKISCNSTIDSCNQIIVLTGIKSEDIQINYSGDIDFTPLVTILAEMINIEKIIDFNHEDLSQKTEKEKLIIETLKNIIDSYNDSINQNNENQSTET